MSAKDDKKTRVVFSPKQLCLLEEHFAANNFPKATERKEIASKLNVSPHSIQVVASAAGTIVIDLILSTPVQIWFQNKRAKSRKKEKRLKDVQIKKFVPKPPPFWPENLPFDSNITGTEFGKPPPPPPLAWHHLWWQESGCSSIHASSCAKI